MKKILSLLSLLSCLAHSAQAAITIKDDRGVSVSLPEVPKRIVSLLPSLTETICALGECARLVGTDRFSNYPASAMALPKLGGMEDTSIEALVALKPDVIVLAISSRLTDRLEALGLKVVALEPKTLGDVQRVMTTLAQLLNKPDEAKRLWTQIDAAINKQAAALMPAARGLLVYYEVDSAPYAAGTQSFMGEILTRLGARNIVPAELGPFPKLNPEFVVRADPQVIMVGQRSAPGLPQRPGWGNIRAVKDQKLCVWVPAESDMLVRPGPRMAEAAALMARCLSEAASGPVALPTTPFKAPPGGMR
ncbi:ABC transporter substrate-binding protein [Roseateles sp.]|uniref:ABC transporter substrate-binding protein n=1 Tax=Roseateles sp. TaxID=1971397 RepID=UPI00286D24AB|nr:ABC transporter substrate-binding protein [Roseateles sp.]